MVALAVPEARTWRRLSEAFTVVTALAALGVVLSQSGDLTSLWVPPLAFLLMVGLAVFAATQAFLEAPSPGRTPMVICPTVCFTFAVLVCWGLGPAIVAQLLSIAVVQWKLRLPARQGIETTAFYLLAFGAASLVLWLGNPDPFQQQGPTNLLADAISVVGAVVAWLTTFGLLSLIAERLHRGRGRRRQTIGGLGNQLLFKASLLLLSPVLAVAAHINIGFVPLVFVPLYAVQRMARLSAERDRAARMDPLTNLANRTGLRAGFADLLEVCRGDRPRPGGAACRRVALTMLALDMMGG